MTRHKLNLEAVFIVKTTYSCPQWV